MAKFELIDSIGDECEKMIKINYEDKGQGFPVILIHGLSDDLRFWDPIVSELSKNYRTIAFDLRGHGKSDKPEGPYSIKQFVEDIYGVLLRLGIKEAHFIGFSMGSAILLQMALDHPQIVNKLVLISSFSFINHDLENNFINLKECLVEGGFSLFFDKMVPLVLLSESIKENQSTINEIKEEKVKTESEVALINSIDACLNFNIKNEISKISKPVLIICGKEDIFTPLSFSKQIYKSIKDSKLEIIENTGHNILILQNIPQILEILTNFLD